MSISNPASLESLGLGAGDSPVFTGLSLTGRTSGSLTFFGASGLLNQDSAELFWDDTNNRLGVGTASPQSLLHVSGNTGVEIRIEDQAVTDAVWRILPQTGNTTKLFRIFDSTANSDRLVIDANGNVGIGTTTTNNKVNIVGSNDQLALTQFGNNASASIIDFRKARGTEASPTALLSGDSIYSLKARGHNGTGIVNGPDIRVFTTENWSSTARGSAIHFRVIANGATNVSEVMRLDQNGNVGIGTTAPTDPLEVAYANSTVNVPGISIDSSGSQAVLGYRASGVLQSYMRGDSVNNIAIVTLGTGGIFLRAGDDTGNDMVVNASGVVSIAGTLEIGTPPTYTETNVTTDRAFNANFIAIPELADVVGTLIQDLRAMGIVN